MRLARLPFVVLATAIVVSCSSDATGVQDRRTPVRPDFSSTQMGSGTKTDSTSTSTSTSVASDTTLAGFES